MHGGLEADGRTLGVDIVDDARRGRFARGVGYEAVQQDVLPWQAALLRRSGLSGSVLGWLAPGKSAGGSNGSLHLAKVPLTRSMRANPLKYGCGCLLLWAIVAGVANGCVQTGRIGGGISFSPSRATSCSCPRREYPKKRSRKF